MEQPLPIPSDFPVAEQNNQFAYNFFVHSNGPIDPNARWTSGPSLDGLGEFSVFPAQPMGQTPALAPPVPQAFGKVMLKSNFQADGLTSPDQRVGLSAMSATAPVADGTVRSETLVVVED